MISTPIASLFGLLSGPSILVPMVYIFILLFIILLYLLAAFVLGVIAAMFTLPVLYYTGYGLVPPIIAPNFDDTHWSLAAVVQLVLGGVFGAFGLIVAFVTDGMIPFLLKYRFARVSPRFEKLPALAVGIGIVLAVWLGYLVIVRSQFTVDGNDGWWDSLLASLRAAIVYGICFLALAVLSTFILHL